MQRGKTLRNLSAISVLAALVASGSASAAILQYGCLGYLDGQLVVFNRDGLYLADAKTPAGKARRFTADTVDDTIKAIKQTKDNVIEFGQGNDGELDETIRFTAIDANKQEHKAVVTYVSSKRLSHKHRMICGRDEDTDLFRSVYRYAHDEEPAREVKMQCFWYQLSTRGGRKGCD